MKVFGIISDERALKSKSPAMHTRVLRRRGLEGVYVPFRVEPDHLGEAVRGLRALNISGANVTVPYKETVIPLLDGLSEDAAAIGAVNTIVGRDGLLLGHNTDAGGFSDSLEGAGFQAAGRSALVFGTGGAARAVAFALHRLGAASLTIVGRNGARAAELAWPFQARWLPLGSPPVRRLSADLVVNATSASSRAESPELAGLAAGLSLAGCRLVLDLNYGRSDNFWRDLAADRGAAFRDGLLMLAHQARRSFALWTGLEVEVEEFLAGLEEGS